jgi:hypothetical protein
LDPKPWEKSKFAACYLFFSPPPLCSSLIWKKKDDDEEEGNLAFLNLCLLAGIYVFHSFNSNIFLPKK